MNEPGWASTPRGRKELLVVGLFCVTFAVVPLLTTELYPFSRAPMFADAPRLYCDYVVRLPDGRQLTDETDKPTLTKLGVQRNYWGNPLGVGVGYEPPLTVDDFGKVADKEVVVEMVTKRLEQFPDWRYVEVVQTVVRPAADGRIVREAGGTWRVNNPYYKRAGGS